MSTGEPVPDDVSALLRAWTDGDQRALAHLTSIVYDELHRLAHHYLKRERAGHTLQTTALVNEAYMRLVDYRRMHWQNRAHFLAVSAQAMRRILVDRARRRNVKRGADVEHVSLDAEAVLCTDRSDDFVSLDEALTALAERAPRKAKVVELRFFGGLSVEETAEVLRVSSITVMREWKSAKAWLYRELAEPTAHGQGAGAGARRPLARREADVRDSRRDRPAIRPARTGGLVRSGHSRVGGVLRECGRRQANAARALERGRGREVDYAAAFALALAGDLPQSRALAGGLAREFPEDTFVQFMYLPTLHALFSLNTGDPAAAIQALQTASRYDLALGGVGFIGRFGGLYPIYVRGVAYLAARQPVEAAAEFQRILDHRSIVLVDPMDALARLQLARALALSGDAAKAKGAYDDVFALWKNADPDIPILKEARAEYARLP